MVEPLLTLGFVGDIVMLVRVACVTVSVVDILIPLNVAVIVAVPVPVHDASPFEPDVLLIVATAVFDDTHDTEAVRFCDVPSE
jgi:hypothetical protein